MGADKNVGARQEFTVFHCFQQSISMLLDLCLEAIKKILRSLWKSAVIGDG
jgi:hypothetical protein